MKLMAKMLTTTDNPYNPFDDFDSWYAYDQAKGHCTCEYLARSCNDLGPELSELETVQSKNAIIEQICRINATGNWTYVEKEREYDIGD